MTSIQNFAIEAHITRPPADRLLSGCSALGSHDHTVGVRVSGELDRATARRFTEAIAAASRGREVLSSWATHPAVELDLSQLSFCDLGGITAICEARAALLIAGFRLCLSRPQRNVTRFLSLAVSHGWLPADVECSQLAWVMGGAADLLVPQLTDGAAFVLPSEQSA
ncbi:MAG: STAS domain-containing protein [Pseudonocardiales bacterium]|nr:STAS domain-containing protein [Pseudonocardiales bacterium]